jgi:hypothetical protein
MGSPGLYVFPASEGRMRRSSGFFPERMLRRTLAKSGIVEHYALKASADLHAVQRILRHRNPQTTMRTYGHLQQDYLHEQIARMSMRAKASPTAPPSTLATPLLLATNNDPESRRGQKRNPALLRGFWRSGRDSNPRPPA